MRPLKLVIQNFGPYQNETINFAEFNETPLFLISGNTGAGKTTIFDAMCFALFGRTSGGDRDGKQMRSEFATVHDETVVGFTFEHQGRTYQIVRKPDQLQAKKRGEGTTNQSASVELTVFDHEDEVDQLTKIKTVENYLDGLLHLTADQFMQIVLLPQGKFQSFLAAPSDEKERVLRDLFGTEFFDDWAQQLHAQNKAAQSKVSESKQQVAGMLAQLSWDEDYAAQIDATTLPNEQLDLQQQQASGWQEELGHQKKTLTELQKRVQELQTKQTQELALKQSIERQEKLNAQLADLQAQQSTIDGITKRIQDLNWAKDQQPLAQSVQRTTQRITANKEQINELTARQQDLQTVVNDQEAAVKTYQEQQADYDQLSAEITSLAAQEKDYQAVADLEKTVNETEQQQAKTQAQQTELTAQQNELKTEQTKTQKVIDQAELITQRANQIAQAQQTQQRFSKQQTSLQVQERQVQGLQNDVDQLVQKQTLSQTKVATVDARVKKIESAWAASQIAILAEKLEPGTPCPVCGSTDHPAPAAVATSSVTEAEVEQQKQALGTAQADLNQINVALAEKQTQLAAVMQQLDTDRASLIGEMTDQALKVNDSADLAELQRLLDDWHASIVTDLQENTAQQHALAAAREQNTKLATQMTTVVNDLETATNQDQKLQSELAGLRGQLASKKEALPGEFANLESLQQYLSESRAKIATFKTAVEQANQRLTAARADLTSTQGQLSHAKEQLQQQQAELKADQEKLGQQVQAYLHTTDITQLDELLTQLNELAQLNQQLNEFQTNLTKVNSQLQLLAKEIDGRPQPDLTSTEESLKKATDESAQANQAYVELQQRMKTNQQLVDQITVIEQRQADDADRLSQLNQLAQTAVGNNPQRLSLERYVLQTYLQRVLDVANSRLDKLTAHRYQFCLDEDSGRGRSTTGLEIDVYDDPAGKIRSVHTLSGGESFIAALSLALALGEVIQNQAGGIQIDALFVDEGFGSLDQNALDTAIEALKTIEGQNRVIGIISHVTELKVRIPDQLQVVADGNGHSHTKIQVN